MILCAQCKAIYIYIYNIYILKLLYSVHTKTPKEFKTQAAHEYYDLKAKYWHLRVGQRLKFSDKLVLTCREYDLKF